MKVKELKKLLDSLNDEDEIAVYDHEEGAVFLDIKIVGWEVQECPDNDRKWLTYGIVECDKSMSVNVMIPKEW